MKLGLRSGTDSPDLRCSDGRDVRILISIFFVYNIVIFFFIIPWCCAWHNYCELEVLSFFIFLSYTEFFIYLLLSLRIQASVFPLKGLNLTVLLICLCHVTFVCRSQPGLIVEVDKGFKRCEEMESGISQKKNHFQVRVNKRMYMFFRHI